MKWITRERPKIDRIACPWLIRRFIDKEAEFIFVPAADVLITTNAIFWRPVQRLRPDCWLRPLQVLR